MAQSPIDLKTGSRSEVLSMQIFGKDFKNYDEKTVYNTIAGTAIEAIGGKLELTLGDGTVSDKHET